MSDVPLLTAELIRKVYQLDAPIQGEAHISDAFNQAMQAILEGDATVIPTAELEALRARVAELEKGAERYRWLRERDLDTITHGGVFAGQVPENFVISGKELDEAIDAAIDQQGGQEGPGSG